MAALGRSRLQLSRLPAFTWQWEYWTAILNMSGDPEDCATSRPCLHQRCHFPSHHIRLLLDRASLAVRPIAANEQGGEFPSLLEFVATMPVRIALLGSGFVSNFYMLGLK